MKSTVCREIPGAPYDTCGKPSRYHPMFMRGGRPPMPMRGGTPPMPTRPTRGGTPPVPVNPTQPTQVEQIRKSIDSLRESQERRNQEMRSKVEQVHSDFKKITDLDMNLKSFIPKFSFM